MKEKRKHKKSPHVRSGKEGAPLIIYPMLEREIAGRGITKKAIAESLGISQRSLSNKLTGRVPFTWPEVSTIQRLFFPDMTPEEIMAQPNNSGV